MSNSALISSNGKVPSDFDRLVRTRIIRLNATLLGIVIGVLCGTGLFLMTNILVIKGGRVVGPHLALLGQVLIGYRVTFVGSLIGFVDASIIGWLIGYCGAKLYNLFAHFRER
jgi:hypothetical protein